VRLIELNPEWVKMTDDRSYESVDTLAEAQGLWFLCPVCFQRNSGVVGTHHVLCWFAARGVLDSRKPGPGRWTPTGTDFKDLSLAPSILLPQSKCEAHFHVINGEIQ
jgi:hypothetical protein